MESREDQVTRWVTSQNLAGLCISHGCPVDETRAGEPHLLVGRLSILILLRWDLIFSCLSYWSHRARYAYVKRTVSDSDPRRRTPIPMLLVIQGEKVEKVVNRLEGGKHHSFMMQQKTKLQVQLWVLFLKSPHHRLRFRRITSWSLGSNSTSLWQAHCKQMSSRPGLKSLTWSFPFSPPNLSSINLSCMLSAK